MTEVDFTPVPSGGLELLAVGLLAIGAWDTPPDATSTYTVYANVLYRPASADLKTLTLYEYQRAVASGAQALLRRIVGAAGTWTLELVTRQVGRLNFEFTGILPALPENVADPGQPAYDPTWLRRSEAPASPRRARPPPVLDAEARLGGLPVRFNRFSFDDGGEVRQPDDPGAAYGTDVAGVTDRAVTGSINPNLSLLSTRNNLSDVLSGAGRSIVLRWGASPGNRISLFVPRARYTGATPGEVNAYAVEEVPFKAAGFDDGVYLCLH